MSNAVVIGRGMVGNATMDSLGIKDFYSRSEHTVPLEEVHKFQYIFICLPTPTIDGKQNLDGIRNFLHTLDSTRKEGERHVIIIRSTILPGTCEKLERETGFLFAHVPEFLTEDTWEKDAKWPDIIVVGSNHQTVREEVAGIFKSRFKGSEYYLTDYITAETIKYAINVYYALKVIYANQLFDFCEAKEINYDTVKKAMYSRKWIGRNHLEIWHKGGRGAGGKCLEKDLDAFANFSNLPLLEFANKINKAILMSNPKKI